MKVLHYSVTFLAVVLISNGAFPLENLSEKEKERKALNEKYDKLKLRGKTDFVIDCSHEFLRKPKEDTTEEEFTIAKHPPVVKMMILPDMKPEYFSEGEQYMAAWANWAHMTRSDDNRFYFPASDHRGYGCNINLYEYCPGRDILHKVGARIRVDRW